MNLDKRLLVPIAMLGVISVGGVYAFLSLTVTTTVTIGEPLSITAVTGTGDFTSITCDTLPNLNTACTVSVSVGATGTVDVTVANSGTQPITVTPAGFTNNPDVTVTTPSDSPVAAGGSFTFNFGVSVSPSATTPGSALMTFTFSR